MITGCKLVCFCAHHIAAGCSATFENQIAKGEVTLFFQVFSTKHVNFYLTDIEGKLVQTFVDEVRKPGGYNVSLDSTKLANGKYYYCIKTENQQTDKLLIVQN